eukprot:311049-Rhodomonas_salina.1
MTRRGEVRYEPTRVVCGVRLAQGRVNRGGAFDSSIREVNSAIALRVCYEMPGTEVDVWYEMPGTGMDSWYEMPGPETDL